MSVAAKEIGVVRAARENAIQALARGTPIERVHGLCLRSIAIASLLLIACLR